MGWDTLREVLYGLVPTAGVLAVFSLVVRAILRADESERRAAREFGGGAGGRDGTEAPGQDSPEAPDADR
ncbi:MAG: hypothetical protein ACFCVG_15725 [Kineosporiaceae bacterium]